MSAAPTPKIGHRSSPVNGSVPGSVFVDDWFVVVVAPVVGVVDVAVGVDVVVPVVPVDGAEDGVELGVVAAGVVVGVDTGAGEVVFVFGDPEEPEVGFEHPASGSTYWLLPAELFPQPPDAAAAAGPASDRRTTAIRQLRMYRGCTPRVLQG